MIHSIFVRGYFIPDKARKTHRRTEDIVVDIPEHGSKDSPKSGIQHIFTASSFKSVPSAVCLLLRVERKKLSLGFMVAQ